MKQETKESRIVPMNDEIYDGLFLEELEARLETDPLLPGGLLNLVGDSVMDSCTCRGINCGVFCECNSVCGCDGLNCGVH